MELETAARGTRVLPTHTRSLPVLAGRRMVACQPVGLPETVSLSAVDRTARAWQQVYTTLRNAIVAVELEPGLSVSEAELALHLGTSRTPVREALIRLSEEGLVGIYPQLGTVISPISLPKVYESLVIRSALECRSLRDSVKLITDSGIASLYAAIDDQKRAVRQGNDELFLVADDLLHRTIVEIGGNTEILKVIQSTKAHHDRVRHLSSHLPAHNRERIREHEDTVAAIARGDVVSAEQSLERHLDPARLTELWSRLSQTYSSYFE